jgi:hypothetical protein
VQPARRSGSGVSRVGQALYRPLAEPASGMPFPSLKISNRGHSLTIDHGWREVAEIALNFVKRFA